MHRYLILSILIWFLLSAAVPPLPPSSDICSQAYGTSLPERLPDWLWPVEQTVHLQTAQSFEILSGHLLRAALVDGSRCPAGGLNADGSPNACGLETAREEVTRWQNRYDTAILASANGQSVPAKVIKALIAVESQFWPAANWEKGEIGLGQMTEMGADLVLAWRPDYFQTICAQGLDKATCAKGYGGLDLSAQRLLRGLVLKSIDATCPTCQGGVDPAKGDQAVAVISEALGASCRQTNRTFWLATGKRPAELLSYEDFWRLSLANYHIGTGCVYQALRHTGNPSSWNAIAINFSAGCGSGAEYIRRIEENLAP